MAKLESNLINMASVLTGISLFAAVSLSLMYSVTKEPVEAAKVVKAQDAIREVLPAFERLDEPKQVEVEGAGTLTVYKAYDGEDRFVGAAVESFSNSAFNGEIKVMVGFDREGNITNYSVLDQKETPGLGTKMTDWFKPQTGEHRSLVETVFGFRVEVAERKSSVVGKNPAKDNLTVSKDGGEIDGITAATISSRAFLHAVRVAYAAYASDSGVVADGLSGATEAAGEEEDEEKTNG
ncbi:MAG: RnfABCDGE type electron transport complex subunit G [Tannerella sp.]|jgi:electron transport complex protein RnfG|nr:RnfABCDGE type electron transport complex subunit G [Tannerella sp.]